MRGHSGASACISATDGNVIVRLCVVGVADRAECCAEDAICVSPLKPVFPSPPSLPSLSCSLLALVVVVVPPMQGLQIARTGRWDRRWMRVRQRAGEGWRESQGPHRALILLGHGPDFSLFSLSLDGYFFLSLSTLLCLYSLFPSCVTLSSFLSHYFSLPLSLSLPSLYLDHRRTLFEEITQSMY